MKIDKTSKRILYLLDLNGRVALADIAKKLKLPEATLRYRIQTLISAGIVRSGYPVLGVGRLGMSVHKLMFKLQKANEVEIDKFVAELCKSPLVNWVARFDGSYDLGCTLLVKHVGEVYQFVDQTRKRFHSYIRQISYAVNIHAEFFPRDYLIRDKRPSHIGAEYRSYPDSEPTVVPDSKDWHILHALADDIRTPATLIASQLKVSSETISRRIRDLEKNKIITGYRMVLDHQQLNRTSYYILLYLNLVSEDRLSQMLTFLREHSAVVYLIKMLGAWDYDISIELEDALEYRTFMIDLMKRFSDIIRDSHTLNTWEVAKFSILPATARTAISR